MTDWQAVLTHPDVEPWTLCGLSDVEEFYWFLGLPHVEVEEHPEGGIVYVHKDGVEEVHVAFLPCVWGREVSWIIRESFSRKMSQGATLIVREQEGYFRSRPPKCHGWKVNGDFEKSEHPRRLRQWILTPDAWYRSAIGRKYAQ